ncbi:MAG TPA: hypothetical protein IAC03_00830 [Candidatus Coprenecus pullistercoris]|nr:hypothetical protein [Candidatus Coprenecus pullistercoris]
MNLRVIKKDVNFLIDEFLSDVFISMSFTDDAAKSEQIVGLANEALDLRDATLVRISHPEGDKKAYYRNLTDELLSSLDVMYDRLSAIVSKKSEKSE